jgi:hypothetical protein
MKHWMVAKYDSDMMEAFYFAQQDRMAVAYVDMRQREVDGALLHKDHQVYFTDTQEQAEKLAITLSQMFPMIQFIVAESKIACVTPAGEVARSRFTADGIIPE